MVGQLLADAGVYFGETKDLMPEDARNPRGYLEHTQIFGLSRRFLREAGAPNDLIADSLRSRGWGRVTRLFTRRAMLRTVDEFLNKAPRAVGMKLFPLFLYAWSPYLPSSTKLIIIYRHPLSVASSFLSAWPGGIFTISYVLKLWTQSYRELLIFRPKFRDSVVVCYEDLLDTERRPAILEALRQSLELPIKEEGTVDALLDRATKTKADIPLPQETEEVLSALDNLRLQ